MAVLWITKLVNNYGSVTMNQTDTNWNPELLGQGFTAKKEFNPNVTNWKSFPAPWAEAGKLIIKTKFEYECLVGPLATDPNTDYLQVKSPNAPGFDLKLGARGRNNKCCTLTLKPDGTISFDNVVDC